MKLLIIEDESDLRQALGQYFTEMGARVEQASDFNEGLQKAHAYDYDCLLLDISLPLGSGMDILKSLKKEKPNTAIIIISAKNSLSDKITGLDLGADDYVSKPFHFPELNARVKALIRRKQFSGDNKIELGDLTIHPDERSVLHKNLPIELTAKEFDILLFFAANRNRVITKQAIAEHLWGDHMDQADSHDFLYSQIKNLRKKLQETTLAGSIKTVYGLGYKFSFEA